MYTPFKSESSDAGPRPLIVIQSNSRAFAGRAILNFTWRHMAAYIIIYIISYHIVYMRFDDDWWTTAAHHPPVDFSSQPTVILYKRVRAQQHTHSPAAPLVSTTLVRRCASYIIYNISFAARAFDSATAATVSISYSVIPSSSSRNTHCSIYTDGGWRGGGRSDFRKSNSAPTDRIHLVYTYDIIYDIQRKTHTHTHTHTRTSVYLYSGRRVASCTLDLNSHY